MADRSPRVLSLRYPGTCATCQAELPKGTRANWNPAERSATCLPCFDGAPPVAEAVDQVAAEILTGTAGASAHSEGVKRIINREAKVREAHPRIGGVLLTLAGPTQSEKAWLKGAEGERRVAKWLDELTETGCFVLHDRAKPKSRANIDHIVIAPSGVYVIDAKYYAGELKKNDVGGWLKSDERLYIAGRDNTKLAHAVVAQAEPVKGMVAEVAPGQDISVNPMLCFTAPNKGIFTKPFTIKGALVSWPRATRDLCRQLGPIDKQTLERIALHLSTELPPAK